MRHDAANHNYSDRANSGYRAVLGRHDPLVSETSFSGPAILLPAASCRPPSLRRGGASFFFSDLSPKFAVVLLLWMLLWFCSDCVMVDQRGAVGCETNVSFRLGWRSGFDQAVNAPEGGGNVGIPAAGR